MNKQKYDNARADFMKAPTDEDRQAALFHMMEAVDARLASVERLIERMDPTYD